MIQVEEVSLDIILPVDGMGMVVMQPFVELSNSEPFRWQNSKKDEQIERIIRTLEIAKRADHNCDKTHFTVFPEYTIPGLEGVRKINEILENDSWQNETIVIGGIDGLTKGQYATLCSEGNTTVHPDNLPEKVGDNQWINCCITWVKGKECTLKRFVQPKLCPSWPEENVVASDMFEGKSVYVFECQLADGRAFRFITLLCFDWIGAVDSQFGVFAILGKLNCLSGVKPYGRPLHLSFVLQKNEKPNHPSFLNNVYDFFHRQEYQFVLRSDAVIAMLNTAGAPKPSPANEYGYSCLVFSPNSSYEQESCPPTYALTTKTIRGNEILRTCKEALFRENGACIHSFRFFHPLFVSLAPEDRRKPIGPALVHACECSLTSDPRTPGAPVPAVIKWTNDKIDMIDMLHVSVGVKSCVNDAQRRVNEELRRRDENFLHRSMKLATVKMVSKENVDIWSMEESRSLETLVYALSIIASSKSITMKGSPAHATLVQDNDVIDFVVIFGETHEDTLEHTKKILYLARKQRKTIVISRDKQDSSLTDKDKPIYETGSEIKRVGFYNLRGCLDSSNETQLRSKISEILGV